MPAAPTVTIVVPVLDEAEHLPATLASCIAGNDPHELIVVDGGSRDPSPAIAAAFFADHTGIRSRLFVTAPGRGDQLDAGAAQSRGDVLLFLHADTRLPPGALAQVRDAVHNGALWGRFDVTLAGRATVFRMIETLMNWRSRASGISTGDQAMFVRSDLYRLAGGCRALPLMEDVDLARRLKMFGRPARLRLRVSSSARRWQRDGVFRTIMKMWLLRGLYFLGVPAQRLARWYR